MFFKHLKKILPIVSMGVLIWVFSGNVAHAQLSFFSLGNIASNAVFAVIASAAYVLFTLAGQFLALCGTLLNVSLQLTTHLGNFIQSIPQIFQVWSTIRDLASMLLIFLILWAAIQMILNLKQANYGQLLKSIVIAGILINFSFFFAQVLIDGSNIISLQFYNAIAPNQISTYQPNDPLTTIIQKSIADGSGGLSGIFANALRVNQWWTDKSDFDVSKLTSDSKQMIAIALSNTIGALVQFVAGLSFLAAASAALMRTVILLFLLCFSAVWVAAYSLPQLGPMKSKWMNLFKSNLLFLPVYLAFMYVSVIIIQKANLGSLVQDISVTGANSSPAYLSLFITFAIILLFINIPLFAAISVAGATTGLTKKISDWSIDFSKRAPTALATKPLGYFARSRLSEPALEAEKRLGNTKFGNSLFMRDLRSVTTGSLAKQKWGLSRSIEDRGKEYKDINKKNKEIQRTRDLKNLLPLIASGSPLPAGVTAKGLIGQMSDAEKIALGADYLSNPEVLRHLKGSTFEAIKKSDMDPEDIKKVLDARKEVTQNAITSATPDAGLIKDLIKNYDGLEILGLEDAKHPGLLDNHNVMPHYNVEQVRKMADNTDIANFKDRFHTAAVALTGSRGSALGWIINQRTKGDW